MIDVELLERIDQKLAAIVALLVEARGALIKSVGSQAGQQKDELLLARAGLKATEIASILGKSEAAVQKALQREHAKTTKRDG